MAIISNSINQKFLRFFQAASKEFVGLPHTLKNKLVAEWPQQKTSSTFFAFWSLKAILKLNSFSQNNLNRICTKSLFMIDLNWERHVTPKTERIVLTDTYITFSKNLVRVGVGVGYRFSDRPLPVRSNKKASVVCLLFSLRSKTILLHYFFRMNKKGWSAFRLLLLPLLLLIAVVLATAWIQRCDRNPWTKRPEWKVHIYCMKTRLRKMPSNVHECFSFSRKTR